MPQPINPYIAGNILQEKEGFLGRQDTLEWVARELRNLETNALVLFGQRRIGKTSLLYQLERILPRDHFLPVYFDLQDQAMRPLGQTLSDLAAKIAKRAGAEFPDSIGLDDQGHFFKDDFLPLLYQALGENCRPVFLLDEFDVLNQATEAGLPDSAAAKALFPCLRSLMTREPRIAFVFVVGRRAEDLSMDFTSTFKTALAREIWVLDRESAESLVRQAEVNNTLQFTDKAVSHILYLTHGHPYLTQLLCQRIWERAYAGNLDYRPEIDQGEVEAAIPDALEVGDAALRWIWDGLGSAEKVYAAALAEIAEENKSISETQVIEVLMAQAKRLRTREVELAPRDLVKRLVLEEPDEHKYHFIVDLFRRWVCLCKPLREVQDELDQINRLAEDNYEVGMQAFHLKDWDASTRFFQRALEMAPLHFRARLHLGEALLKLGRVDEAVKNLKHAYELDQDKARLLLARALVAQAKMRDADGDQDSVLAACSEALDVSPTERAAQELIKDIWIRRGNTALERQGLDTALEAYHQAGIEGWADAVVHIRRALRENSDLFCTRLRLGEILLELDRTAEAVTEIDTALERAYQKTDIEQEEEAITFFRQVLKKSHHRPFLLIRLGQVLRELDRIDEALFELEKAYAIDPEEASAPLAEALMVKAQAAHQAGDLQTAQDLCVRVMEIAPTHPGALDMLKDTIVKSRHEKLVQTCTVTRETLGVSRKQLHKLLTDAERHIHLLGVAALDADWEILVGRWARRFGESMGVEVVILCESDNTLFSKSFTLDTEMAENRRSFRELRFTRDRAIGLPALLHEKGIPTTTGKFTVEITHLPIPVSIVHVDNRLFANLWLHEIEDYFEEIGEGHPWRSFIMKYVDTYFAPEQGRKYACGPQDEVLELFDHERIPRGIYPRSSFYDTDYSQLVVWVFVFDRRGRLLIHRRADNAKDNRGMWDKSVGGHIEFSDRSTSHAAFREVIEELFIEEPEETKSDLTKWSVSDKEIVFLGEWRPRQRKDFPFREINMFKREWAFFRLRESAQLYSPRLLPSGKTRRLRVIPDIFLFVAGPQLNDGFLKELKNSTFKLVGLAELKSAMDKGISGQVVPGFDANNLGQGNPIPKFTPDLVNIMTGQLRDVLEEFSQYVKTYIKQ